jgi:hypothetical protein
MMCCCCGGRFQLEQRILELESGRLEHHVRAEDHAALKDERDRLAGQLRMAADSEARLQRQLEAEKEQVGCQLYAQGYSVVSCWWRTQYLGFRPQWK